MGDRDDRREGAEDVGRKSEAELAAYGAEWLTGLLKALGLDVRAEGSVAAGGTLEFNIKGKDSALCVEGLGLGRGQLAGYIQTVLTLALQREGWESGSMFIDVEGTRRRATVDLTGLAAWLGDKVTALGKPITILGMSSGERRSIHAGLGEDGRVHTESEGYGAFRRLKIR